MYLMQGLIYTIQYPDGTYFASDTTKNTGYLGSVPSVNLVPDSQLLTVETYDEFGSFTLSSLGGTIGFSYHANIGRASPMTWVLANITQISDTQCSAELVGHGHSNSSGLDYSGYPSETYPAQLTTTPITMLITEYQEPVDTATMPNMDLLFGV